MSESESSVAEKICPRCEDLKSASDFGRNRARPDGLAYCCKACFGEIHRRTYREREAAEGRTVREAREVPVGLRWCPDCAEAQPLDRFPRHAGDKSGLGRYCKPAADLAGDVVVVDVGLVPQVPQADDARPDLPLMLCFTCNAGLGSFADEVFRLRRAAAYLDGTLTAPTPLAPGVFALDSTAWRRGEA